MRRPLLLAILLVAAPAAASTTTGFDRAGGGPRSAALGGHVVALTDDDHALGSSPGRLVFGARSASAQYDRIDPDVELWRGRVAYLAPLGKDLTEPYQKSTIHRQALGVALDMTGLNLIEGSGYRESAVSVAGGFAPAAYLGFGIEARYERASSDVSDLSAHAWGVDLGGALDLTDHLAAALVLRNALGRATFEGGDDEDRSGEFTFGLAATHRKWWQAEFDWVYKGNATSAIALGAEAHVVPGTFDLRGGVSQEKDGITSRSVLSAGAGFVFSRLHLDYAFRNDPDGSLEAQHQLALTARF